MNIKLINAGMNDYWVVTPDGIQVSNEKIDVFQVLAKLALTRPSLIKDCGKYLLVHNDVQPMIFQWTATGFGGLSLFEYLDKMLP